MKQTGVLQHSDPFEGGLELVCTRISAVCKSNPPPYIHCSKINTFLLNIKEISKLLQSHRYETPKRLLMTIRSHFQGLVSILEQFHQIHTHCCRDTCAQFALTTSMRSTYNEFYSMRKEATKHLEALGLSDAAQIMTVSEAELLSQNEVDIKRVSIIVKQLRRRKDVKSRPDVIKHLDCRTASLVDLGISLEDEDTEVITVPELPPSLNFILLFDDLNFGKFIGSGQSGRVVHGFIKSTGEEVAIKVLHTRILSSSDLDMFRREIFTMAVLSHPMLVKFCGYTADSPFCIVTEYMSNGSLFDYLKANGNELTPTERTLIALDVARGMEFLHSRGIIHRDLKSLNVLLDSKKRGKICDFGLSRIKSSAPMTGLIGTTLWMAPEVLLSTPFYDEKVDVYSFGILLWELLTGNQPYDNKVSAEITIQIVEHDLRPAIPESTPEPLKKLITGCWETIPSNRPSFTTIVTKLSDPMYQIPGSEQMTFLKEAGLSKKNHYYSNSSPMNISSHAAFRNLSDHHFMWVSDNASRAVKRIQDAISAGHIEHFNNSISQLRAAARAKDVDWSKVIPLYVQTFEQAPQKFHNRLLQVFFELIYRPGAVDFVDNEFIARVLNSHDDEATVNIVLANLNYNQFPMLFKQSTIEALLGFSRHPQQTIRIKALVLLFDVSKHKNCANLEFIHGLLSFAIRKLPVHLLTFLLSLLKSLLEQVGKIDDKVMERLLMLMKLLVQDSCLSALSDCIVQCLKFDNDVISNSTSQIWTNSIPKFDHFSELFTFYKEKLPDNYTHLTNALCFAAESFDGALETLIDFCQIHECVILETIRRLPIKNQNYILLSKLYFLILDYEDCEKILPLLSEFYFVSKYLFESNKIDTVCNIYRNYQLNYEYLVSSNVCEAITNLFIKSHDDERSQIAMMSLIFAISCNINVPIFWKCVPHFFTKLRNGESTTALPAFICLCVMAKYRTDGFDANLLALNAAKYISSDNQMSRDAATFAISTFANSLTNLNSVIETFFANIVDEKNPNVRNFAKILHKLSDKDGHVISSYINRLNIYQ